MINPEKQNKRKKKNKTNKHKTTKKQTKQWEEPVLSYLVRKILRQWDSEANYVVLGCRAPVSESGMELQKPFSFVFGV